MSKGRNVWGYWECPQCKTIIRGDNRNCPNCGSPIPNGQKYLPPDHPKVREAIGQGRAVDEYKEYVPDNEVSFEPNWTCGYCGYQNRHEDKLCKGCGSPRYESEEDYFGNEVDISKEEKDWREKVTTPTMHHKTRHKKSQTAEPIEDVNISASSVHEEMKYSKDVQKKSAVEILSKVKGFFNLRNTIITLSVFLIAFLIWLFFPVTKEYTIEGFSWDRSIDVEEFTLCHEDDWSVPQGGRVQYTKSEIHHYDQVLDHYETKSREVAEEVFDGYDTSYTDDGNGQFTEVQTPRYRTEYHTEYYEDPVYRDEPVYYTKYYYDIDRWLYAETLKTSGNNQTPVWPESNLVDAVENPEYGDQKLGQRTENYYVTMTSKKGTVRTFDYSFEEWSNLRLGDVVEHKGFRFD